MPLLPRPGTTFASSGGPGVWRAAARSQLVRTRTASNERRGTIKTKLITTLTGTALALGIFSQSGLAAAALGCKYTFSITNITKVGNFSQRECEDKSASGAVQLEVIAATTKTYKIFTNLLKLGAASSRMRLTTQNGSTLGCDLVDQALDNTSTSLFCTFPNATPATTAIFNAGDSVGN